MNSRNLTRSLFVSMLLVGFTTTAAAKDFVQDAEYYVLKAQHGHRKTNRLTRSLPSWKRSLASRQT